MEVGNMNEDPFTTAECKTEPTEEEEEVVKFKDRTDPGDLFTEQIEPGVNEGLATVSSDLNCYKPPDPIEMVCIKMEPLEEQEDTALELYSEVGECDSPPTPAECKSELTEAECADNLSTDSSPGARRGHRQKGQRRKRRKMPPIDPSMMSIKVVTGCKTHQCAICQYNTESMTSIRRHLMTHSGEKPFVCDVCSSSFTQESSLHTHVSAVHSKIKPYKCNSCGLSFGAGSSLKEHLRTHSGDRPFKCGVCAKAFARSSTLRRHEMTHTGIKPYVCEVCAARFIYPKQLKVHMSRHLGDKPHECDRCSYKCATKGDLNRHVERRHTGTKRYGCAHCQYRCASKWDLAGHLSRMHTR